MRNINIKTTIFFALSLMLLVSCKKDSVNFKSGNITGFVDLIDVVGNYVPDKSGVKVTIVDKSGTYTATTDNSGKYLINSVPMGTYDLEYSKTGYGIYYNKSISHVGGDVNTFVDKVGLLELIDFKILNSNVYYNDYDSTLTVEINYDTSLIDNRFYQYSNSAGIDLLVYFNDSSDVSIDHYDFNIEGYVDLKHISRTLYPTSYPDYAEKYSYHSPQTLYYTIYSVNPYQWYIRNMTYYDPETKRVVNVGALQITDVKSCVIN
jgi:hypothetical protein